MDNIINIEKNGCTRLNHVVNEFCLPNKSDCDKTVIDGIFTDCDFNCSSCGVNGYMMPVPMDGKINLQTNFNSRGNNDGWGTWIKIKLYDKDGNEFTSGIPWHSKELTARAKYDYQTTEIDVSLIPLDCFYFKIEADNEEPVCTQLYHKEDCENLIEIEGLHDDYDCWNNYYGKPIGGHTGTVFEYSNKIYLKGMIKTQSLAPKDGEVEEVIRFIPSELIPTYMANYITYKILAAKKVKLNGKEYYTTNQVLTARPRTNMFQAILEFTKSECKKGIGSCN